MWKSGQSFPDSAHPVEDNREKKRHRAWNRAQVPQSGSAEAFPQRPAVELRDTDFFTWIPKDFLVRVRPLVKMGSRLLKTGSPEFG